MSHTWTLLIWAFQGAFDVLVCVFGFLIWLALAKAGRQ